MFNTYDPTRIRTKNLPIRSQTPYPLGHRADDEKALCFVLMSYVCTLLLRNVVSLGLYHPARIRTWNPLIRSQMPYPLGHRTC